MKNKRDTFTEIFNHTKRKIFNFVLKMTSDRMLAEDITQNTFLKFFESLEYINDLQSAEFWLFKTARNEVYQVYRTKKIHVDQYGVDDIDELNLDSGESLHDSLEKKDLRQIINIQLDSMPAEQKEVYLLKEYGGFSYNEISSILGIDEELVKSRLHKARQKLIKRISKLIN
ncbi:MAG: RNA polymerase sigma factor [Ignavibacteriales bacterium]|nr:MAG: RNA polymerase sigma factor [Ignavibacteriales bacterium]